MARYAAERGSELFCPTGTNTMTETVAIDRVSASALTQHLDCSRTYLGKREAEGVI